jgi:tripartite-type tricarboxylate transporter receptor subunit TctC
MLNRLRSTLAKIAALFAATLVTHVHAQWSPTRPVRLIAPVE